MALDVELYRRTLYVPTEPGSETLRRISVIDIAPRAPAARLSLSTATAATPMQWLPQVARLRAVLPRDRP